MTVLIDFSLQAVRLIFYWIHSRNSAIDVKLIFPRNTRLNLDSTSSFLYTSQLFPSNDAFKVTFKLYSAAEACNKTFCKTMKLLPHSEYEHISSTRLCSVHNFDHKIFWTINKWKKWTQSKFFLAIFIIHWTFKSIPTSSCWYFDSPTEFDAIHSKFLKAPTLSIYWHPYQYSMNFHFNLIANHYNRNKLMTRATLRIFLVEISTEKRHQWKFNNDLLRKLH